MLRCKPVHDGVAMAKNYNTIYKGLNNPVLINKSTLPLFDRITLEIGGEVYDTVSTPDNLFIEGDYLTLQIGNITALSPGGYVPEIMGYSETYPDGYLITNKKTGGLPAIVVMSV